MSPWDVPYPLRRLWWLGVRQLWTIRGVALIFWGLFLPFEFVDFTYRRMKFVFKTPRDERGLIVLEEENEE